MGFRPVPDLAEAMRSARAVYVVGADPAGDDPRLAETGDFLVVQELFLTATAKLADVVLPAQAYTEREGTYTTGERRVQRFYPAVPEKADCRADFAIAAQIAEQLSIHLEGRIASKVMANIAENIPDYTGLSYSKLAEVSEQWPIVGRGDLYYGGTTYENSQGLGVQLTPAAQRGAALPLGWPDLPEVQIPKLGLLAVPVTRLYDRGQTVLPSKLLHQRIPQPYLAIHPDDASRLRIPDGATVELSYQNTTSLVAIRFDERVPVGVILVPRSMGVPINSPQPAELRLGERVAA
jgi:NADH-quinone oxidoreductase subunit G